jgi:hypothetical protein
MSPLAIIQTAFTNEIRQPSLDRHQTNFTIGVVVDNGP